MYSNRSKRVEVDITNEMILSLFPTILDKLSWSAPNWSCDTLIPPLEMVRLIRAHAILCLTRIVFL